MPIALAVSLALLTPAPQAAAAQLWTDDVLHLVDQIERLHPDPFFGCPKEDFEAGVDAFLASLEGASEPRALSELMRLVARLSQAGRDGHTMIWPVRARYLPLRTYGFADGWFVVAAEPAHERWLGAELVSVGGVPIADACARLAPLLTGDNEWNRRTKLAEALLCGELLAGVGLAESPDVVRVELARGGEREELELPATYGGFERLGHHALPARPGALWLQGREQSWRYQVLEAERALYVQYNEVAARGSDGRTLAEFAGELVRTFAERGLAKVIVDVRSNGGGDNTTFRPLIEALRTPALDRPGVLFGLIGRETFSAAGNFVTVLERETKAILVGEPTGGAPNQYGDAVNVPLPNHPGVLVRVSTRYHAFGGPDDARLTHEPHLPAPLRARDYFEDRDPALRAALDYQPPR